MATLVLPPDPLVSLGDMKVALGESGLDKDGLISTLILAAQSELDGPNGWVGIAVASQTVRVRVASFDDPEIRLAGQPINSVIVSYFDTNGDEKTLDNEAYEVGADGALALVGAGWPEVDDRADAVTVTYNCGGIPQADPRHQQMRTAIILHVRMTLDGVDPEISRKAIESLVRSMWVPVM